MLWSACGVQIPALYWQRLNGTFKSFTHVSMRRHTAMHPLMSAIISVRMNDRVKRGEGDCKKMAYLMDLRTIAVIDFTTSANIALITHDTRIDW